MGIATAPMELDDRVTSFLAAPRKMLIDGKWIAAKTGKNFDVFNPATGEVMARVAEGDKAEIDLAVKAARKAFDEGPWRKMTASERGRMIWKLADLIEQNGDELATLESMTTASRAPSRVPRTCR